MDKMNIFRKIIREEIVKAIREELPKILNESKSNSSVTNVIKQMKSDFPSTLNTVETYQKNKNTAYSNSSRLNELLNETANSMQEGEYDQLSYTTDNISPTAFFQPREASVGDINGMLSTANKSMNLEAVQINQVPDYSNLMKKILNK